MNKYLLLILILTASCRSPGLKFMIANQSGANIDSIQLTNGFDVWKHGLIIPNQNVEDELVFSDKVKYDGSYEMIIFRNNKSEIYRFGYYSNGIPESSNLTVEVKKDTIDIKEKGNHY